MSFQKIKTTDNREARRINGRLRMTNGKSWTRRCQWLEDSEGRVKFKFEVDDTYKEVLIPPGFAQIVWDRFKEGQSIEDACSIFANPVPKSLLSKKGAENG